MVLENVTLFELHVEDAYVGGSDDSSGETVVVTDDSEVVDDALDETVAVTDDEITDDSFDEATEAEDGTGGLSRRRAGLALVSIVAIAVVARRFVGGDDDESIEIEGPIVEDTQESPSVEQTE